MKEYANDLKALIGYSNDTDDIYENIDEYNPDKKPKIFNVFDHVTTDMFRYKKLKPILTELFITRIFCFQYVILFSFTKKY